MVISIINQKGGVGKTTTAINIAAIAAALVEAGHEGLLIDLDTTQQSLMRQTSGFENQVTTWEALPCTAASLHTRPASIRPGRHKTAPRVSSKNA